MVWLAILAIWIGVCGFFIVLIYIFLMASDVEHLFKNEYFPFVYLSWRDCSDLFYLFLNWVAWFLLSFENSFYNLGAGFFFFVRYITCQSFLPVYGLPFHSLKSAFQIVILNFAEVKFSLWIMFLMLCLRNFCLTQGHNGFLQCFFLEVLYFSVSNFIFMIHFEVSKNML